MRGTFLQKNTRREGGIIVDSILVWIIPQISRIFLFQNNPGQDYRIHIFFEKQMP